MNELKQLMAGPPRLTLAVAESLTCGRVQARVGMISGASEFFLGGITAYSLSQKVKHLGVDRVAAGAVNGVSAEIASQMARGVCAMFGSDVGIATTGYAEPWAEWDVSEPFAWWALAQRRADGNFSLRTGRVDFPGAVRTQVQEEVAEAVMSALLSHLREMRREART
ncbi:MAG TPA: CinA family protein [Opitutaceae bacterium]|nr:CinA family protein [Opitutaceae bacterium]